MRRIALEDLREPQGRRTKPRTPEEVLREYEEKYAPLLHAHEANDELTVRQIRELEVGDGMTQMSFGDDLYEGTRAEALAKSASIHIAQVMITVMNTRAASVVDLGCGYGYLLARVRGALKDLGIDVEARGGELSPSAVALAEWLHRGDDRLTVERFDFRSERYGPLEKATGPCVLVTSYALHQLSSAAPVVRKLARYKEKIAAAVTLEPEQMFFANSPLLEEARWRYQGDHGYSADLLLSLEEYEVAEIEDVKPNVVGANVYLPGTLAVWRFR